MNRTAKISQFPNHIFWSYKKDAELNYKTVIKQVFLYGDISDIRKIFKMFSKEQISEVVQKIKETGKNKKRTYFIEEIYLKN